NLGIETIILPKFLEVIEDGALSANALKEIELPNTLLEMAVNTFANNKDQVKLLVKDKDVLNRFKNQTLNGAVLVDKIVHEVPNNPPQVAGEQPFNQNVPTRDSFMDQKPTQAVNTGDDNPMAPLAGIAVGSLVLAIAVLLRRKKGSGQI
ncbi:MAG: LPXTG cell wall anchor domain-containing protein, partial [Lachnospiraceae bacterium]